MKARSRTRQRGAKTLRYALAAVALVHLLVTFSLVPPGVLFGGEPIARADYSLHFARAWVTDGLLTEQGRIWGYNPYFLAGYPAGTVFDVNNHFIELFVWGLHQLGPTLPTAFNLFVFLAIALAPLMTWATARNYGLPPDQCVIAATLGMMLWLTDQQVALTWRIGVIASGVSMYTLPLTLSLLNRYLECRSQPRGWLATFLVSGTLVSLLHPSSFLFFWGAVALYLIARTCWPRLAASSAPRLDPRFWGAMSVFAAMVLAVNLVWILPLLQHLPLKTASGYHWVGDLRALLQDVMSLRGGGLRPAICLLGVAGLILWWCDPRRDPQGAPEAAGTPATNESGRPRPARRDSALLLAIPCAVLTSFGYLGGYLEPLRGLEPYRNNLVVAFVLIIPAVVAVDRAAAALRAFAPPRRLAAAGIIALGILLLTARNLFFFAPYLQGELDRHALLPLDGDEMRIVQLLREGAGDGGHRVLVERWQLGALIPFYAGREVIGGPYPLVWMPHNFANFVLPAEAAAEGEPRLFGRVLARTTPEDLRRDLSRYGVGWIVVFTDESKALFDRYEDLYKSNEEDRQEDLQGTRQEEDREDREERFSRVADIGPYRIYRVARPTGLTLTGVARVEARPGSLYLREAAPGPIVLGYHWSPTLVADSPQPIRPCRMGDDPVPFIFLPDNQHPEVAIFDRGVVASVFAGDRFVVTLPDDAPACPGTSAGSKP